MRACGRLSMILRKMSVRRSNDIGDRKLAVAGLPEAGHAARSMSFVRYCDYCCRSDEIRSWRMRATLISAISFSKGIYLRRRARSIEPEDAEVRCRAAQLLNAALVGRRQPASCDLQQGHVRAGRALPMRRPTTRVRSITMQRTQQGATGQLVWQSLISSRPVSQSRSASSGIFPDFVFGRHRL